MGDLKSKWVRGAAFAAAVVTLGACAEDAPQDALDPAGPFARQADRLWDLVFAVAVAIFFIVQGLLVYALVRYRRRPGREAAQFHGHKRLEIVLTLVPSLLLAWIAIPTVSTIMDQAREPDGALQVKVGGRQFWFRYEYTDLGVVTANELYIPVGVPVRLDLEGFGNDVIHAFWVPRLAGKQDVVPGRSNKLTIEADEPGVYLGQCTEFCGAGHAYMRLRVVAQSPQEFDAWVAGQREPAAEPSESLASAGADVFEEMCTACHAIDTGAQKTDDAALIGPNLTHFASRDTFAGSLFDLNEENLADWLRDPPAAKPGSRMPDYNLTEQQIDELVAYLMGLR